MDDGIICLRGLRRHLLGITRNNLGDMEDPHNQVKTVGKYTAYFEVTVAAPGIAACYWLPGVTGSPDHMALKLFCGQETSAFHTYTNAQVTC